jgi:hypothetical protein
MLARQAAANYRRNALLVFCERPAVNTAKEGFDKPMAQARDVDDAADGGLLLK